jgi:glycosyltransferase involved in cell wall biosynthesis
LNVRWHTVPDIVHGSKLRNGLANVVTGIRLRPQRPGVLHVHSTELYGALPQACAISGLQRIVHVHLEQDESTVRWAFRRPPDLVVTCAKFLVENVRQYLPDDAQRNLRIVAVPNCADTAAYYPGDKHEWKHKVGAKADLPLLLMLANLAPHKGQATAIRAVAELKQRGIDVQCYLAGTERAPAGSYRATLLALIDELGVSDRVSLLGFRDDGPELMRAADFFLLPSTREGLPLSVLEAQASGAVVLASPTAGTPEVVADGETGFLIAANDAAGYANRLAQLIGCSDTRSRIAEQALARCRSEHSAEAYCQRMWEIYAELLEGTAATHA